MAPELCLRPLSNRSKYLNIQPRLCQRENGHGGKHSEFPFLQHLQSNYPSVRNKIVRDSTMTTGAAWKIETSHANPRLHNADNVGFAHRECNIAQGNKTLDEFYAWIADILQRVS